jgi:hypothetical protein
MYSKKSPPFLQVKDSIPSLLAAADPVKTPLLSAQEACSRPILSSFTHGAGQDSVRFSPYLTACFYPQL